MSSLKINKPLILNKGLGLLKHWTVIVGLLMDSILVYSSGNMKV